MSVYSVNSSKVIMEIIIDEHRDKIEVMKSVFDKIMKIPDHKDMPWEHVYDLSLEGIYCDDNQFIKVCNKIGDIIYSKESILHEPDIVPYFNKFINMYLASYVVSDDIMLRCLSMVEHGNLCKFMLKPFDVPQKRTYDFSGWKQNQIQEFNEVKRSTVYEPVGDMRDMIAFMELYYTNRLGAGTFNNDWYPTIKTFLKELNLEQYIDVKTHKKQVDETHVVTLTNKRKDNILISLKSGKVTLVLASCFDTNDICYRLIIERLQQLFATTKFPEYVENRISNHIRYKELNDARKNAYRATKKKPHIRYASPYDSDIEAPFEDSDSSDDDY